VGLCRKADLQDDPGLKKVLQNCVCLFNSGHDFNHLVYTKALQTVALKQLKGQ